MPFALRLKKAAQGSLFFCATVLVAVGLGALSAEARKLVVSRAELVPGIGGKPELHIILSDASRETLAEFSRAHIGKTIMVRSNDRVLLQARLMSSLEGGQLRIANSQDMGEMQALVRALNSGDQKLEIEAN